MLLVVYSVESADNWLSRFDNHTKLVALLRHPRFKLVTDLCMPSRLKMGTTTFKQISKACPHITYLNIANAKNCKTLQLMEIANCMPNLHTFVMGEATGASCHVCVCFAMLRIQMAFAHCAFSTRGTAVNR
jgi:hypothetical protein